MPRLSRKSATARLRAYLAQHAAGAGVRLPGERLLAAELGCSRANLRLCLDELERTGEIWRRHGQGTFTGPRPRHLPVSGHALIEGATPSHIIEARLLLEPPVAAEAARRADAADAAFLRARLSEGRAAATPSACEQADDRFHRAIATVAGNPVLAGVLAYLSGARRRAAWQRGWEQTYRRLAPREFQTVHCAQHEAVVEAIAAGDAAAAERAMQAHLETIRAAMPAARR
ncbi:FadR/GntR family transcriptional regulator [Cribrihabitans neustonicus]|uniref:FadR/GntR family transcriptional regulator n=1 Tax=Cribrihabitans neustonicus TaxID=1429085 RepID=UPI003B58BB3D